jgi:hypothetical protein
MHTAAWMTSGTVSSRQIIDAESGIRIRNDFDGIRCGLRKGLKVGSGKIRKVESGIHFSGRNTK